MSDNLPASSDTSAKIAYFTQRESELYLAQESTGFKPIAPSLAANLYQLFLEGYSCKQIASQGKGLDEGDILNLRRKYKWDEERSQYVSDLMNQVQDKVAKAKMESVEFLTNQLSAIHKASREQTLKYLMTGNPDDMPKEFIKMGGYKQIVEILQKVTGEERMTKVETKNQSTVVVKHEGSSISPELQDALLKSLSKENG